MAIETLSGKTLISKSELARRLGRANPTISQWIERGRITPAAVVDGKIWYERAMFDLKELSDDRRPTKTATCDVAPVVEDVVTASDQTVTTMRRRRNAEAQQAELKAERLKLELAKEEGRWLDREEAEKAWGKVQAAFMQDNDFFIVNILPKDLAAKFDLDWRLVATEARASYRRFQADKSKEFAEAAE